MQLHNGGKKDSFWNPRDFLGYLLLLPCPGIEVNQNHSNQKTGRVTEDSGSLGINISVTPPDQEPQWTEILTERGANAEWLVGPEAIPLGENLKTSYRKEDCFVCLMMCLFVYAN